MTAADILGGLLRMNLAAGAAILAVVALRKMVRSRFGARVAYGLWLLPVLAGVAILSPARQIFVVESAAPAVVTAPSVHQTVQASPSEAAMGLDPSVLLVGLWLVGALAAAVIMALLQHRFMRQASAGAVGPAVVGVIAPRIVTPRDFAERYSGDEQALVLAHEQAHIARQDSRLNGLCAAAQCLCWFNPLVHIAARLMRIDQELACDEAVVARFPGARRTYAEVLVKAQLAILPLPLGCYWPSKSEHPLVERVAMLTRKDIGRARRSAGVAVLAALCAGVGLGAWAAQPADVRLIAPTPERMAAGDGPAAQTPDEGGVPPKPANLSETPATPALAVAETRSGPEPLRPVEGIEVTTVSPTPVANADFSKASLIPVASVHMPDADQPLGPGHYVQESGPKQSLDCRDRDTQQPAWHSLSTPLIAPGHVIANFHYELRGDGRCETRWPSDSPSARCEVVTDKPDRKIVRFQLLTDGDYCSSYSAFARDGSQHDGEARGWITEPGAVTRGEMVLSYDVQ